MVVVRQELRYEIEGEPSEEGLGTSVEVRTCTLGDTPFISLNDITNETRTYIRAVPEDVQAVIAALEACLSSVMGDERR